MFHSTGEMCKRLVLLSIFLSFNEVAAVVVDDEGSAYMILGVSGTLQNGFPLRHRMDYHNIDRNESNPAIFLGQALVRGYKAFLDVKDSNSREYMPEPFLPTVPNAIVLPTGCYEHANVYHIFAVDTRQYWHIFAGEPRFLSVTADTGMLDLQSNETDEMVRTFARQEITRQNKTIDSSVTVPLVTGVWFQPSSFIESPPIRIMEDGTKITSYDGGLALWAGVVTDDLVSSLPSSLMDDDSLVENGNMDDTWREYAWGSVYTKIRDAEKDHDAMAQHNALECSNDDKRVRFGVGSEHTRINYSLPYREIAKVLAN